MPAASRRPKDLVVEQISRRGVVAVVRAGGDKGLFETIDALVSGGLTSIEITLTTPGAIDVIKQLAARYSRDQILLGAGTVLEAAEADAAIAAGVEYIISPSIEADVIDVCRRSGVVSIPGAHTPTEVRTAVKAAADIVKIFPASIGGPTYIKDLSGPLPGVKLLPSGGVNFDTVGPFFAAGSFAVAVGSLLVDKELMRQRKFDAIAEKTRRFMDAVAACRKR